MSNPRIFLAGATGYIGGSILTRILKHPKRDTFDITILIRAASKARAFESFGLKVVIGSLDDVDVVERLAYESDVVIQSADADHISGTNAILKGLKKKFEETKIASVYIQTSGTGALTDKAGGEFAGGTIYSDLDTSAIEAIPLSNWHRPVDTTILAASEQGYVKTYIVFPSNVWGIANNAFTEKDLQRRVSVMIPALIAIGAMRGTPMIIGKGVNIWPHINIEELGDFYYALFDAIISGKDIAHGREGYYFVENGEHPLLDVYNGVAKYLFESGKVGTDKPLDLTEEERVMYQVHYALGSNSRARGDRARTLAWKPVKGTDEYLASIKSEVEFWVKANST